MKFENCILKVRLCAQSPMLHFQGRERGATLRASEVKPKLDRFILNKLKASNREKELTKGAYMGEKGALNYKMTFRAGKGQKLQFEEMSYDNGKKKYFNIVYGDRMGKELLLYDTDMQIMCMNSSLQKVLEEYLNEFFAVTNFGYMQNKGFGSFMPEEYLKAHQKNGDEMRSEIAGWLKEKCGAAQCYYMDIPANGARSAQERYERMFSQIKDFYDLLKTGRNLMGRGYSKAFIYQYMLKKEMNNEKAWMKSEGIAPAVYRDENKTKSGKKCKDARYVRALLGTTQSLSYIEALGSKGKRRIRILNTDRDRIERLKSPIFFTIISDYVFICPERIPNLIYGRTFSFEANGNRKSIQTPSKAELDKIGFTIDGLLEEYVSYYNEGAREQIRTLKGNAEVKKVKTVCVGKEK